MATLDLGRVIPLERGAWAASTDYVFMDSVQYEGSTYVCIAGHTAALGNRPTTTSGAANYWRRNSRGFEPKGTWNASLTYDRDNLVDFGGSVYRCTANTTAGINPSNGSYWESFAQGIGEFVGEWQSNTTYVEGSIIIWDIDGANTIAGTFRANQDVPQNYNPGDFPAYWDEIASGFAWQGTWSNSTTYRYRSVVTHHGYLYIAANKGGGPQGEDPTAGVNWSKLTEGHNFIGTLESLGSGTSLFVGDTTTFANGYYQVIGNTNGGDDPRQTAANFRPLVKWWDWQGSYSASTIYYLDQVLLYQNSIYRVLNTTTTGQNPDNASALFQVLIEAPDNFTDYNSTTKRLQIRRVTQAVNDAATYSNGEPVAITDGSGNANGKLYVHDASTVGGKIVGEDFPSGTKMLFQQTAAPTGWTKDTTHNDKALRVVTGTAGTGGTVDFSTAFVSHAGGGTVTVDNTALNSTTHMPSHNHGATVYSYASHHSGVFGVGHGSYHRGGASTHSTGGNGNHNHSASFTGTAIDLAVSYIDLIIATKD